MLEPGHSYLDDGYSGSVLLRPALERLRDAVASGHVERLYVHAPDRLARRYAHQALLIDEFRRAFCFRASIERARRIESSSSLIVPFMPSSSLSLG
ncbi:recombinase family protein [Mesorhizobium sp. M1338]|uniref:recombinase family protein n=1 Tax=Mesorhizobium sp. M1338 TaxID=2957085 RepID=UPI00333BE6BB